VAPAAAAAANAPPISCPAEFRHSPDIPSQSALQIWKIGFKCQPVTWELPTEPPIISLRCQISGIARKQQEKIMGKGLILWMLGVPGIGRDRPAAVPRHLTTVALSGWPDVKRPPRSVAAYILIDLL